MTRNKSAKKRAAHRKRVERLHSEEDAVREIDYGKITEISKKFGVHTSQVFCGYLAQPISYSGSDDIISGYCVLADKNCSYHIPGDGIVYDTCPVYKAIEQKWIAEYNSLHKFQGGIEKFLGRSD